MTEQYKLDFTDSHGDKAEFQRSDTTGYAYVSVNGEVQVRLVQTQQQELIEFLAQGFPVPVQEPEPEPKPDAGLFYLIRQRKDNPLKLKVMFANTSSAKMFTSRASADQHQEHMTRQHGDKFKFFVTEAV